MNDTTQFENILESQNMPKNQDKINKQLIQFRQLQHNCSSQQNLENKIQLKTIINQQIDSKINQNEIKQLQINYDGKNQGINGIQHQYEIFSQDKENLSENYDQDDEDLEQEEELDEDDEDNDDDGEGFSNNCNIIQYIKFCRSTKAILLPIEYDFFAEILSRADIDISQQVKHSQTNEAAQDELLICLGLTLRDKLQTFWKNKKSDEITKSLFLNKCAQIIVNSTTCQIQKKLESLGKQTNLEDYLKEEQIVQEAKKEKLKKKRQRKREKRKKKDDQQITSQQQQDDDDDEQELPNQETINILSKPNEEEFRDLQQKNLIRQDQIQRLDTRMPIAMEEQIQIQDIQDQHFNNQENMMTEIHIDQNIDYQDQAEDLYCTNQIESLEFQEDKQFKKQNIILPEEKQLLEQMGWQEDRQENVEIEEVLVNYFRKQWQQIINKRKILRNQLLQDFKVFSAKNY